MLSPIKAESLHVEGVFQANLILGALPSAVMPLQAGPIFEPWQIHAVQSGVIGELTSVKFSPTHQHGALILKTGPVFKHFDGLVKQWSVFNVLLHNARQFRAEGADFGVKFGANKLAEVIDNLEMFIELHRANFNDFHRSRPATPPACGLQIVNDKLTVAHLIQRYVVLLAVGSCCEQVALLGAVLRSFAAHERAETFSSSRCVEWCRDECRIRNCYVSRR